MRSLPTSFNKGSFAARMTCRLRFAQATCMCVSWWDFSAARLSSWWADGGFQGSWPIFRLAEAFISEPKLEEFPPAHEQGHAMHFQFAGEHSSVSYFRKAGARSAGSRFQRCLQAAGLSCKIPAFGQPFGALGFSNFFGLLPSCCLLFKFAFAQNRRGYLPAALRNLQCAPELRSPGRPLAGSEGSVCARSQL